MPRVSLGVCYEQTQDESSHTKYKACQNSENHLKQQLIPKIKADLYGKYFLALCKLLC